MPRADVLIFNASADEPAGDDVVAQITGAAASAESSAVSANEQSNSVQVLLEGAPAHAASGDVNTFRNVSHTIDFETGEMVDDRFYPDPDSAGNKCFPETASTHTILAFSKSNPATITVATDPGWSEDNGGGYPDGLIIRGLTGAWGAGLNDMLIRPRNSQDGGQTFDCYFDHFGHLPGVDGYMGDGQGVESLTDDADLGANPLDTTTLSGVWPGNGYIEGIWRRADQLADISPGSNTDQTIIENSGPVGGDTVTPRKGNYFLRDTIHYNKPYDRSVGTRNWGNSGHNKPRSQFTLPANIDTLSDTEVWIGWSIYLPSDYEDESASSGAQAANTMITTGDKGFGEIRVITPGPGSGRGEVLVPGPTSWFLMMNLDDTTTEASNTLGNIRYANLGEISDDKGLWTDWVIRLRWNPFTTTTNASSISGGKNQVYEANKGILQIWKSTGPYIDGLNRQMIRIFDREDQPVGVVPPVDDAFSFSLRQYKFAWHRQATSIYSAIPVAWDQIHVGETVAHNTEYSDVHPTQQSNPTP